MTGGKPLNRPDRTCRTVDNFVAAGIAGGNLGEPRGSSGITGVRTGRAGVRLGSKTLNLNRNPRTDSSY